MKSISPTEGCVEPSAKAGQDTLRIGKPPQSCNPRIIGKQLEDATIGADRLREPYADGPPSK